MRDELADLVADVRAHLEEAGLRGVRAEPRDVDAVASFAPPAAAEPKKAAASSPWAKVAAVSRAEADIATEAGAPGLKRIRDDLGDCRRCKLCKERRNIVYGVGSAEATLMVVGEAPGHDAAQVIALHATELRVHDVVCRSPPPDGFGLA